MNDVLKNTLVVIVLTVLLAVPAWFITTLAMSQREKAELIKLSDETQDKENVEEVKTLVTGSKLTGEEVVKNFEDILTKIQDNSLTFKVCDKNGLLLKYTDLNELNKGIEIEAEYIAEIKENEQIFSYMLNGEAVKVLKDETVEKEIILADGEIWGTKVLSDYNTHRAKIESKAVIFEVVETSTSKVYEDLETLQKDVKEKDVFIKSFETDAAGNLTKYSFKRVIK